MKKRMISLLLCLCMVFSLLPTAVLAADGENPDASAGPGQVMQQNPENPDNQAGQNDLKNSEDSDDLKNSENSDDLNDSENQDDLNDSENQDDLNDPENPDDSDAPQPLGEGLGSELSGKCGATEADHVTWELTENEDGHTLTISGNGAMADYYAHYVQREDEFTGDIAPWRRALLSNPEDKRTTDEVVPITEVEIGEGVTRIGSGAFAYTALTGTVTFSKNVTSYGDGVFARDTSITAVDWTNFQPTEKITDGWANKVYTEGHIAVPYAFFDGCSSLNTSIIDGEVYSRQLVLPNTIEAIYVAAFRGTGFSTVDFSNGLSSIRAVGSYAITGLENMTEFTYPGNVDFYGMSDEGQNNVIQGGGIQKLTIAKEVTKLPVSFCTNTENLTAIEFESGSQLTEIGKTAFYNTQALKSIDIPSTVTSIGESAFANCFSLKKIELGQIESLGQNTFANCSSLETVKIQGSPNVIYPPNMFSTWGGYNAAPLKTLEIGAGNIRFGLNNQKDSIETIVLGDGVTEIPNHFAAYCTELTSVSLPDALTSVPTYAFNGCSSLKKIGISEKSKLQSIGNGAFANSALTQIYIPKGVTSIGQGAFNITPITVFDMSDVIADHMEVGLYAINNWFAPDASNVPAWKNDFKYIYVSNSGAAASVKEQTSSCNYAFFVTNGGSVDATKTGFAAVYREGFTAKWYENKDFTGNPVTGNPVTGKTYYAKWMDHIPEPEDADFTKGLVTVKCLSPVACHDNRFGLTAAAKKYTKKQLSATEYSVTYDADAFAVHGHSLYSADKLNWTLTYDGSKWNLAPKDPDVDDVVLVTHAPTTFDEVTKFIDGRTDVIHTSCVNGETATCAYGLMVAFKNPDHVVSVEQEKDSRSGEPIRGSYIATLMMDQFAVACAKACNDKSFADSPRAHDVQSKNPVQWRFKVTQAEVSTDTGAEKQYVWSAEPVTPGTDDVCQVAHRVVLTFSYDQYGVKVDDTKVEYKYNTTEITNNVEVPTPTREGYTFVQWLDAEGNAFDPNATVTEDHTYNNIKWTPINYRVIFDANADGKTVTGTMGEQVFTYDQPQTLNPNQFVCTDSVFDDRLKQDTQLYEFGGWNTKADGSGTAYADEADFTNQSVKHGERITLYAQWKHVTKTLNYVSEHGTAPSPEDVDIFSEVTVAGAPANVEGYTFVGWRSDIDGLRETFKSGDKFVMPNTDVTLTAQWEKEADSYTVTYADGSWSDVKGSYKAGETVTVLAPAPAPEGYTFKYWRSSNEGKTYQPGDTFPMPAANVILTAIWDSETYTITWKNGDAILDKTNVKRGETPEYIGETPTKDATVDKTYTFKGWDPEITAATEDTTYTAQFEEAARTYKITWKDEGGAILKTEQVAYNETPNFDGTPTKDGDAQYSYTFKDWTPTIAPVTGDAEYCATYTKTVNKYTVTWVIDGDSTEETYEYGKMPAHADPVKAATDDTVYTFKGWTPALSIVTGNVTYTAQFTETAKHTVSYNLNGGTPAFASAKYAEGEAVNTPATVPTKTGYVFTGWLVSFENKTVNANGSFTMPNTDVTLTAQWRVAITGNVYIPAMNPEHGTHEEPYSAQLTAKKDNAYGDSVAAGDVQFVLVDANGHADTSRNIGHGLTLNADGSITGTANGAGEVTFRVKLANAAGDFVSDSFEFTIVIEKAFRTCTVTMEDWTYGDEPKTPVVKLSKTEGTETITFYYKIKGADNSTYTTEVPVNAGDYTVKAVVGESANYLGCEATADFKILKKEIKSVSLSVTAPVACAAAQTTIADGDGFTGTITWAPAPVDGKFDYATEYTATVVLTPDSNHYFTANTTAEGWSVSYDADSRKLTLTHKFEKTELGKIETPVIRPNGGRFTGRQTVKITCATEGADIYYTLDGTTPTTGSKLYTGAFKIKESTTVKAIAVKANYIDSAVATAEFTKRTGGNGGGGGGTVVTPVKPSKKDDSLKFNTEDHFAYVNGYPDGTVKPTGDVTRAEVAAILYRVMDADCVKTYETTRCSFSDVVRGDWFNLYVATLENADVIVDTRTNGKFRPNEAITRAELAAMLAQFADIKSAANSFNDVSARHWASDEIAVCAKMGWINGYPDGSFRPDATITRAEMMAMINRALGRTPKSADDLLSGMKTWRDNANVNAWYYLDVQEATNSHTYTKSGTHETWKKLR